MDSRVITKEFKIVYLLFFAATAALIAVYAFQSNYADVMYGFSNTITIAVAGCAVFSSFLALRKYWDNFRSHLARIWLGFTLGMFLWFLGELGWFIYTMILNIEIPYPSFADVFWLSGYIPLFIALLFYVDLFRPAITQRLFLGAGVIVASVSIITFPWLMMPVLVDPSGDLITRIVDFAYPSLDVLLLLEATLGLLVFSFTRLKNRVGAAWHLINAAILASVLGDITFSYTIINGIYYNGHPQELLFHVSYLLFALAFYVHSREL